MPPPAEATFHVHPAPSAFAGFWDDRYDQTMPVQIDFLRAPSAREKSATRAAYRRFCDALERDGRSEGARPRFETLAFLGLEAQGGAERFIDLSRAARGLVADLRRLNAGGGLIRRLLFGEDPDIVEAGEDNAVAEVDPLQKEFETLIQGESDGNWRLATVFTARFGACTDAGARLIAAMDHLKDSPFQWYSGLFFQIKKSSARFDAKIFRSLLKRIRSVPTDYRKEVRLSCWEGKRAWSGSDRLLIMDWREATDAEHPFGRVSLELPIGALRDPRRRAALESAARAVFETLKADVGWISPAALHPHSLINISLGHFEPMIRVLTEHPQIEIVPLQTFNVLQAGMFRPSLFEGFEAPRWRMMLSRRAAARLDRSARGAFAVAEPLQGGGLMLGPEIDPPLDMSESRYAAYREAWKSLGRLQVRPDPRMISASRKDGAERFPLWPYYRRFESPTLAAYRRRVVSRSWGL